MSTADRLLNVLGLFTAARPEWTVDAAACELDMKLSTVYRYFRSLVDVGLISTDMPGRYTLGPAIIQYDWQMRTLDPLITAASPVMHRLAEMMGGRTAILLCRLYRTEVTCVHQEYLRRPDFARAYDRGRPVSLYQGGPSLAILAHMSCSLVRPIYEANPDAMQAAGFGNDWSDVKRRLRKLRRQNAIVMDGEADMQGVSLPIFSPRGAVIGSLSIVAPHGRKAPTTDAMIPVLKYAVQDIEAAMRIAVGEGPSETADRATIFPEPKIAA